jgi:hypothetical protein
MNRNGKTQDGEVNSPDETVRLDSIRIMPCFFRNSIESILLFVYRPKPRVGKTLHRRQKTPT